MINKTNDNTPEIPKEDISDDKGYKDTAYMDVHCHLLIKDKDTGEILVNRRG